jgi:NADPH-dependent 2,4-dienoyl-CoA reductase/sulfur reductase-like enzyme
VIIGASFIGLESAWSLKRELKENATVTVIDMVNAPMERSFGADIGNYWRKVHEEKGVKFIFGKTLKSIEG